MRFNVNEIIIPLIISFLPIGLYSTQIMDKPELNFYIFLGSKINTVNSNSDLDEFKQYNPYYFHNSIELLFDFSFIERKQLFNKMGMFYSYSNFNIFDQNNERIISANRNIFSSGGFTNVFSYKQFYLYAGFKIDYYLQSQFDYIKLQDQVATNVNLDKYEEEFDLSIFIQMNFKFGNIKETKRFVISTRFEYMFGGSYLFFTPFSVGFNLGYLL